MLITRKIHQLASVETELKSMAVEGEATFIPSDIVNDRCKIDRWLGECASFARNAWCMLTSIARISIVIDGCFHVTWTGQSCHVEIFQSVEEF